MTTCPLCGQRDHNGPCYADLKMDWKAQDAQKWAFDHGFVPIEFEGRKYAMHTKVYHLAKNDAA